MVKPQEVTPDYFETPYCSPSAAATSTCHLPLTSLFDSRQAYVNGISGWIMGLADVLPGQTAAVGGHDTEWLFRDDSGNDRFGCVSMSVDLGEPDPSSFPTPPAPLNGKVQLETHRETVRTLLLRRSSHRTLDRKAPQYYLALA